jgi:hypothetical protein
MFYTLDDEVYNPLRTLSIFLHHSTTSPSLTKVIQVRPIFAYLFNPRLPHSYFLTLQNLSLSPKCTTPNTMLVMICRFSKVQ